MSSCLGGKPWSSDSSSEDEGPAPSSSLGSNSRRSFKAQQSKDDEEDRALGYDRAHPDLLPEALVEDALLGFSFGGGGFMLPYHIGVVSSLIALDLARPGETKVGGCSAGSLAATVLALGLDPAKVLETVRGMMASMREGGVFKRLGPLMLETVSESDQLKCMATKQADMTSSSMTSLSPMSLLHSWSALILCPNGGCHSSRHCSQRTPISAALAACASRSRASSPTAASACSA